MRNKGHGKKKTTPKQNRKEAARTEVMPKI